MVQSIFFVGATGYLGGSVLYSLLQRSDASDFDISILSRQESKKAAFEELGLRVVTGSIKDLPLIVDECAKADIVIQCADCDDLSFMNAMCEGFRRHKEKTGKASIIVHTSGTGVIVEDSQGNPPSEKCQVYDDANADQWEATPITAPHREVDIRLVAADRVGDVLSYIVLPSTVYGLATDQLGKGANKGKLMNRHSIQIPAAIKVSLKRGQAGTYGDGNNVWPHVHIEDIVQLFEIVFNNAQDGKGDHGRDGYYIGENGSYVYKEMAKAMGEAMHKRGKAKTAEPAPFTKEDLDAFFGGPDAGMAWYVGSSGQGKGTRSRKFGWKPKYTTEDFYKAIDAEVDNQINN